MAITKKHGTWIAIIVVSLMLLLAGSGKLAGVPGLHQSFAVLGLPTWFGYFIGACEVAGAIGLLIRPLSALAAAGISIIMLGAIYYHAVHTPLAQSIPAVLILGLCCYILSQRRHSLFVFKSV